MSKQWIKEQLSSKINVAQTCNQACLALQIISHTDFHFALSLKCKVAAIQIHLCSAISMLIDQCFETWQHRHLTKNRMCKHCSWEGSIASLAQKNIDLCRITASLETSCKPDRWTQPLTSSTTLPTTITLTTRLESILRRIEWATLPMSIECASLNHYAEGNRKKGTKSHRKRSWR